MALKDHIPALLLAGLLCACKTGPDYGPPETPVAPRYDGDPGDKSTVLVDAWWESFQDPTLTRCIAEALSANPDIEASRQRVRIARAMRRMESSRFYPEVDTGVAYTVDRISENNPRFEDAIKSGFFPRDVEYWDAGLDVTWELDVFGGTSRRVEGAAARAEQEVFIRRAMTLTVAAEVARTYLEMVGNRLRLKLLQEMLQTEEERTRILTLKKDAGVIPASHPLRSQARGRELQSILPLIEAEIRASEYRLAVLMGRRPQDISRDAREARSLPKATGHVPIGLPSELLRRRPDIMAVERRLAAATADIGVATADYFPRFFITGSPRLQSGDFSDLFSGASSAWMFGPSFTWKIFAGGRVKAQVEAARARQGQVFAEYESAVNRALEEVESALIRYGNATVSLNAMAESLASREASLQVDKDRHESGLTDRLEVIDSITGWQQAREAYLDQRMALLAQLIQLYKALGGGWRTAEAISEMAAQQPELE